MKNKLKNVSISEFFKFTSKKLLIDLLISIIFVGIFFMLIPFARTILFNEDMFRKVIDIILNVIVFMIVFHPLACFISFNFFKRGGK